MKFGKTQEKLFGTLEGAYSKVTSREEFDSQITLTDFEADLVLSHFGKSNIHVGNVGSNRAKASKIFLLYPNKEEIKLNIVYPKPEKSELRLYISSRAGFKPRGDEIWFLFKDSDQLCIGSLDQRAWRQETSFLKSDETDQIYQSYLQDDFEIKTTKIKSRDVYKRDRKVALDRFKRSGYECEYDPKHKLFIARSSRKPYLEAHHLVPMSLQGDFNKSLDTVHNVFCLCPYCHRAVHHAEEKLARHILEKLAKERNVLSQYSLDINDLFGLYAVEEIDY